ncbi:hypothetical protein OIDMADRAFT_161591 [Oidiodendron maius Zn]|uniref:Uncharacterized protein n=1 Tax=Oidiodendron maius (strain Zn) TaxID=913774 RepID=A0A0C3HFI7_OIDMZ|nr:hypothetical protein OIDMADRAFT_161591 [Oidiodendron maius Zn]
MQQTETVTATMAAYPALPASPTLTNPDMILPYGEYDSTPSPSRRSYRQDADDDEWGDSATSSMPFSIGPPRASLGSVTPITPIIYGNGTMLSDIGEVTEVESTPGRKLPGPAERRLLKQAQGPLRSNSPASHGGTQRVKTGLHGRKVSMESTSTVTEEPQSTELFKDFDDSVSVDDSNFQGDDEGSIADSYTEEVVAMEIQRLSKLENSLGRDDDPNSSAALSRRAEQILLNAKKRLNNMEGNLTRARSSLYITPSGLMSSIHSSSPLSRSTPSPQNDHRILPQLGVPPAKHRQLDAAVDVSNAGSGHSRTYNKTKVDNIRTSPPSNNSRTSPPSNKSRRTSQEDLRSSDISSPFNRGSPPPSVHLRSLTEDEAIPEFEVDRASSRSAFEDEYLDSSGEQRILSRSTSAMQMRDLRDQMHDLKGRLSVLRDRARDESMKRRSLQSLRTPSPFTAAEQWYTTDKSYVAPGVTIELISHSVDDGVREVEESAVTKLTESVNSETASVYEEASENHHVADDILESHEPEGSQDVEEKSFGKNDEEYGDEEPVDNIDDDYEDLASHDENDVYESDASIYHDATSISHEDREDAFDYEHFFLHSAMGTINQQRLERRGSFSSEDSADTARGPPASQSRSLGNFRSKSAASISTMNTFATATEGLDSEVDDQISQYEYDVQQAVAVPVSPVTADAVKRSTVVSTMKSPLSGGETPTTDAARPVSAIYNPEGRNGTTVHRPSVASFDSFQSTGTTRSFPLVNKTKSHKLVRSNSILDHLPGQQNGSINGDRSQASPVQLLPKEDQILLEKLVATLGKCVSGLQEAQRGSLEANMWRRRLEAARKILDGEEVPI